MRIRPPGVPLVGLLCASLVVGVGAIGSVLLTGEQGRAARGAAERGPGGGLRVERHFGLSPVVRSATGGEAGGTAFIVRSAGKSRPTIVIRARLRPSGAGAAYEAWLYSSIGDAKSLGTLHATETRLYQGEAPLPPGYSKRWRYLDVSRERARAERDRRHGGHPSGESVLRGKLRTR